MTGKRIKALATALAALFAMSGLAASAAQAEGEGASDFWAAEYPAQITATPDEGRQVFTSGPLGGKIRCNDFSGSGVLSERSNELTMESLEYSGECKALGIFPMTIDTNGCHFTFTVDETLTATTSSGTTHLTCPGKSGIVFTTFEIGGDEGNPCEPPDPPFETVHIPGGQSFQGVTYHNIETEDGTMHVTVEMNIEEETEATYEGSWYEGTSTTDSYSGKFIASAENELNEPIDTTITDT